MEFLLLKSSDGYGKASECNGACQVSVLLQKHAKLARAPFNLATNLVAVLITAGASQSYFSFFPPISNAGLPATELAVAETFGFACFGFLASLLPRLPPLPLVIVVTFRVGRFHAETIDTFNFELPGHEDRRHQLAPLTKSRI